MKKIIQENGVCYSNPFMEIRHSHAQFDGFSKNYFVIDLGPRAGVVVVRDKTILMTRQYRFLIDALTWEIPGGKVDKNEDPMAAAIRECREETGVLCTELQPLLTYYPGLDNFNNRTSLFCSTNSVSESTFVPDPAEVVEVAWLPLHLCMGMIRSGEILDALTISGLLGYQCFAELADRSVSQAKSSMERS